MGLKMDFTHEQRVANGRKGGLKKQANREEKRTMREILEVFLSQQAGQSDYDCKEAILLRAVQQAISGDARAREFVRDTIGEKPVDKQELTGKDGASLVPSIEITPVTAVEK